jgi:class 3 adenylate cyclase/tetratricopeptide (TPR) repeat protein
MSTAKFRISDVVTDNVTSPNLTPYVPRLTIDWLRTAPGEIARELEGTMAFVDISGFTAMSERLAGRGKAGAEEVNEVMNATFARLLDVAYSYGGGLLKFGGDALLLFFEGPEHERRAARAAYGMRRTLRSHGRPQTSVGHVTLRMHVGLNSGVFHFFLVGDSHLELIVSGPETGRTVQLEDASEAGDILLSPTTAAALAPRELGEPKGGGVLLRLEPAAEALEAPLPPFEGDLSLCVPAAVRAHVALRRVEPEHRQAAIAFLRFAGVSDALERGGLEAAGAAVQELVEAVQTAAAEHEVTFLESDVDRDGGRIILVAGAPQTAGDDEDRLLRTVRAVVEAGTELPVAVGVSRGRVFAGEVGAEFRRTYTILGDTAALAARLMARARPGQVLAAAAVLERARTRFETRELEPFQVKGKARPVVALDVGRIAGARGVGTATRLPLVDRQRELAVLGASLAPARAGFGSLVELVGDTGIGKTRLVEELRGQCTDMTVLASACEPYDASTAYGAFRDLLRGLLGVSGDGDVDRNTALLRDRVSAVAPELEPWLPLVALPLDLPVEPTRETDELDPAFRRARLHGAVGTLLSSLLPEPTLLVFEDAHWMDEASSELLRHLGSEVTARPWFTCVTRNPAAQGFSAAEGTPAIPALTMRLDPLPADDAKALVAHAAGRSLPAHDVEAIVKRAGGNPLFLQELVAATGEAADVEELPESVEAVITARIDALGPGDRTVLRWASVLGLRFGVTLLAAVLEHEESAEGAEAWDRLGEFLERDPNVAGGFRFRQAVFRDVAYQGLSYRRRRELHRRVAEVYEERAGADDPDLAELLSLHWSRAGDHERTWRYSVVAGERAQAKYANVDAAGLYRRALESARKLPGLDPREVARVWEALGDVSELAGRYADAAEAYRSGRRLAQAELGPQPGLLLREGVIRERTGHYAEALRWYSRGLAAAEELADAKARRSHRLKLTLAYAGVRLRQGLFSDCTRRCRAALEDAQDAGDLRSLAHAYYLMHLAYTELGSPEREAFRGLALPIYEELGDLLGQANVLNNLGIDAYYEGRWDEALDLYRRSREARERIGDVVGAATITNNIGEIESDQGYLEQAEAAFREAYDVCKAAGYPLICHVATSNLGRLAARAGRVDEAEAVLREALAGFEEIRAASFVLETEARLAERALYAGEHAAAFTQATDALARTLGAEAIAHLRAQLERVRGGALLQGGDLAGARECLEESLRIAREANVEYEAALTLELLAALARREGAAEAVDDHVGESRVILARLGVVRTPKFAESG